MSKIKKALERSKAERELNTTALDQPERVKLVPVEEKPSGLSDREQLENDIRKLLRKENPEVLGSMKKEIKLSYSKTKTLRTAPQSLIQNHVFALDPFLETTKKIELLKSQVLKKLKNMSANSLMITSANPNEGKTFISTNLAVSITQNFDRTVMLIDADLRTRSGRHEGVSSVFFNSDSMAGLSDHLKGKAEVAELLINPGIPRLTILPSGKTMPDSASFLGSPKMEKMIHDMKSRYSSERVLIFDCSSCLSNADPLIISKFVDAVLLVVENEKTEISALKRMTELLKDIPIIGIVMNKSRGLY